MAQQRKLPCLSNEISTDEEHAIEATEDPCVEDSENQTTRNKCVDSTVNCFQYCFDAVIYLFQNEDDTNFRYRDGKACLLLESHAEDAPILVILDNAGSSNFSSKENFFACNTEHNRNLRIQTDARAISQEGANASVSVDHSDQVPGKVESVEEEQILNINLTSEGEVPIREENSKSIVAMYIKRKNILRESEMSLKSVQIHLPKMETIQGDKQFIFFPMPSRDDISKSENIEIESLEKQEKLDDQPDPLKPIQSFHVKFNQDGSEETLTVDSDDTVQDMLSRMHEPTANLWLATLGDVDGLSHALRHGRIQQEVDHLSRTALHLAVLSGSVQAVRLLLETGMDPNATDGMGDTPLFYALLKKPSYNIASLLFDFGANIPSRQSTTDIGLFLEMVIMSKPTEREERLMKLLLTQGALLEDPEAPGGRQALHYAAMSNNDELIRTLANLGADLNVVNHRGMTPMDVAVFYSCKEAQFCLEDIGISNIVSDKRSTLT